MKEELSEAPFFLLGAEQIWKPAIRALKNYLDRLGYHGMYKYMLSANYYSITPSVFSKSNENNSAEAFERCVYAGRPDWNLAACLTTCSPFPLFVFTDEEKKLAYALAEAGIIEIKSGKAVPRSLQLISVRERYLLIDAAIHFPMGRLHKIYIGSDTYSLLYYMDSGKRRKSLDLCSGSGIIGLVMSGFSERVVSTDIDPSPLLLIPVNTVLNGAEDIITLKNEDMRHTLESGEMFDLITCNPPFVAIPPGLKGAVYADGSEADGLGYIRMLLDKVPGCLNDGGEAFFVADFPGDDLQPHFFTELQDICNKKNLRVDAFIDSKIYWENQVMPMTVFLSKTNPHISEDVIREEVARFIQKDLRASYYYIVTLKISKNCKTGLRIFNRMRIKSFDDFFGI